MSQFFDNPLIRSIVFYPRSAPAQFTSSSSGPIVDGTIQLLDDVVLGYRLYRHGDNTPVILYFHGNGEIAADHDATAGEYKRIGASLLVLDYRGYGWSTGQPSLTSLLADLDAVHEALPNILQQNNISNQRVIVMGRSLGSACAIGMAHKYPEMFKGLIVESGFTALLKLAWIPSTLGRHVEPLDNLQKMRGITLPLLIIHGEQDKLIPVSHGQALYEASPATIKRFVHNAGAGHNDLLMYGINIYFEAIQQFISQ